MAKEAVLRIRLDTELKEKLKNKVPDCSKILRAAIINVLEMDQVELREFMKNGKEREAELLNR